MARQGRPLERLVRSAVIRNSENSKYFCVRQLLALLDSFFSPLFFHRLGRLLLGLFFSVILSLCHVVFLLWLMLHSPGCLASGLTARQSAAKGQ